jgi:hypothetical protein
VFTGLEKPTKSILEKALDEVINFAQSLLFLLMSRQKGDLEFLVHLTPWIFILTLIYPHGVAK